MAEELLGYIVNTQTFIMALDADDAVAKVKNGEGSVVSRNAAPKPQPAQIALSGSRIQTPQGTTFTKTPTTTTLQPTK